MKARTSSNVTPEGSGRLVLPSVIAAVIIAGAGSWLWAELTTSSAVCESGGGLRGPGWGGAGALVVLATALVMWLSRRLSVTERVVILVATAALSAFAIVVGVVVWEYGHDCLS